MKILDFGLAKLTQAEPGVAPLSALPTTPPNTVPGVVLGTIGYMSPEQVRGLAADHRADIFAFGAILYEMLSGRRAFRGETAMDAMTAILKEDPPDLPAADRHISPALPRTIPNYDISADGQRIVMVKDESGSGWLNVVLNWHEELKRFRADGKVAVAVHVASMAVGIPQLCCQIFRNMAITMRNVSTHP